MPLEELKANHPHQHQHLPTRRLCLSRRAVLDPSSLTLLPKHKKVKRASSSKRSKRKKQSSRLNKASVSSCIGSASSSRALPIPTFTPNAELDRLEKEFFGSDDDSSDDGGDSGGCRGVPKRNITKTTTKLLLPLASSPPSSVDTGSSKRQLDRTDCVYSSSDDHNDDDLLLFRRPSFLEPKEKQTEAEKQKPTIKTVLTTTSKRGQNAYGSINIANKSKVSKKVTRSTARWNRKRNRAVTCPLCSSCPCTTSAVVASVAQPLSSSSMMSMMSHSDAAVEQTLVSRLIELEQTTERYENQTDAVRRTLKKHRREMWRKHEEFRNNKNQGQQQEGHEKSRFLPDLQELEEQHNNNNNANTKKSKIQPHVVAKAQETLFNVNPSLKPVQKQAKEYQVPSVKNECTVEPQKGYDDDNGVDGRYVSNSEIESKQGNELSTLARANSQTRRIDWRDGEKYHTGDCAGGETSISVWANHLAGNTFDCNWDQWIYSSNEGKNIRDKSPKTTAAGHSLGINDQLLRNTMDKVEPLVLSSTGDTTLTLTPTLNSDSVTCLSTLSQRGQGIARGILNRIDTDPDKVALLDTECPKWRENVAYALLQQHDGDDLREALESVHQKQADLNRTKEIFLKTLVRQKTVLSVFEDALSQSLSRLRSSQLCFNTNNSNDNSGPVEQNEGFFMSQATPQPPPDPKN